LTSSPERATALESVDVRVGGDFQVNQINPGGKISENPNSIQGKRIYAGKAVFVQLGRQAERIADQIASASRVARTSWTRRTTAPRSTASRAAAALPTAR
jgi:hypothetical protein